MTDFQAIVLGIIQGITEWLPISSTAHLRVIPALLHWEDPGAAFTAVIQLGTLLACLVYFRKDILDILLGVKKKKAVKGEVQADRKLLVPVIIGTIPVVIAGLLFKKYIEGSLRSLWIIAESMIIFSILLWIAEQTKAKRGLDSVTWQDGLAVGIGQMFALIPGASRSGTTIMAALFVGLERPTAARFSFLLSLPAVCAAGLYELFKERHDLTAHIRPTLIATVVSFVVGLATIDWFMKFLKKHSTYAFIIYRLILGAILLGLLTTNAIPPEAGKPQIKEAGQESKISSTISLDK